MAKFDREARGMLNLVGMDLSCDNSETYNLFDWMPIPFKQSVIETASTLETIQNAHWRS
tara:strand:+ start:9140 stop:9316 length:177 start_codon:yes stop_codon:yes gene_type:complete